MSTLFTPKAVGRVVLPNRIVMSPMTRCRAIGNVPAAIAADYYAARADAGLLVTEGTAPVADGLGYARIPGLFSADQVAGWRTVTDAVHAKGGRIFAQLMHTGRVSAQQNLPEGARVVGPSAIAAPGQMWTDTAGMVDLPVPVAMTEADIEAALQGFADASANAIAAGFDGVELHGANAYLIDQFLNTASNTRADRWGGSVENRVRFALAAVERSAARIGADRVGIRISPYGASYGMQADPDLDAVYHALAAGLSALGVAYLHVVDHSSLGAPKVPDALLADLRATFRGTLLLAGGYDRARADADLDAGKGDLVAFGRPFLRNPDLVGRLRDGAPLAPADPATFYTPDAKGYTDLSA